MKIWSMGIIKFNKGGNYMKNYRISISGNYEEIILDTSYFPIDVRLVEENK